MDWLADILKNLAISKTLVMAIFVTSLVMYLGPITVPGHVPAIQKEFVPYLFAAMVLAGCLLTLWGLAGVWSVLQLAIRKTIVAFSGSTLSEPERLILLSLAKNPTRPVDLSEFDYSSSTVTKLELHQIAKSLEAKSLASVNEWDNNLISLTERGRERALDIQRQVKLSSSN